MYNSPINIIYGQMQKQMEGDILRAVQQYGINVDKEELIRALMYDRNQYEKGYFDGKEEATPKWIPVGTGLPDGENRIAVTDGGYYDVLKFNGHYWEDGYGWLQDIEDFTHWMPLPEPPKEEL